MDEQRVRQIIREELANIIWTDRYVFDKHLQLLDARNFQVGTIGGTKIGTATNQKLGFYGADPVDQPATVDDASAQGALYNQSNVQSIADTVNTVIDRLQELGLIA